MTWKWSWGPFAEKPEGVSGISALRTIAIMLGVVVARCLWVLADRDQLAGVGWPLAAIVAVVTFAVPVDGLFRAVTAWLQSSGGRKLIEKGMEKIVGALAPAALAIGSREEPAPSAPGTVETTTKVTPAVMPMAEGE